MKHKYLLGAMLTLMLLLPVMSVAAFWHPEDEEEPEPECTYFGVLIEGEGTTSSEMINLTEPEYGFCTNVTVEVWICNVDDLYGYKFTLKWDIAFFELVDWVVEDPGWGGNFYCVRPAAGYAGEPWYEQACVAYNPATGLPPGDYKLATLTFHIINDACWAWCDDYEGTFRIRDYEARDSCTGLIETCTYKDGFYRYIPMQPKIWKDPEEEVNCKLPGSFVETVMVDDIVKMKSILFNQTWDDYDAWGFGWHELLTVEKIEINDAVLPKDNASTYSVTNGTCWTAGPTKTRWIRVHIVMECDFPLINITEPTWLVKITFKKHDPWYCGGQPWYRADLETHEITVENVSTPIRFQCGYFDVDCGSGIENIRFGDCHGDRTGERGYAIYKNAKYTFAPIPGDLTGDGVVDLDDLMIIAYMYCMPPFSADLLAMHTEAFWLHYYDFDHSGHIGLEELIMVAKNVGRTC
jgi:hypothetical protein